MSSTSHLLEGLNCDMAQLYIKKNETAVAKTKELPVSELLLRERLTAKHFDQYSHQSRHLMSMMGLNSYEPQASGYGPSIPVPLDPRSGWQTQSLDCKMGIGIETGDDPTMSANRLKDCKMTFTAYCISGQEEASDLDESPAAGIQAAVDNGVPVLGLGKPLPGVRTF